MSRIMIGVNIFFILILLAGCAPATQVNPTSLNVATESLGKASTNIHPAASVAPTTLPTSVASSVPDPFVSRCVDLGGIKLPPPVETANHWLLLREDQAPYSPHLINLANGIEVALPDSNVIQLYVSPDQQRFAYDTYSDSSRSAEKIVVTDATGKVVKTIVWEKDWTFFWGWLGNDHLLVTQKGPEGEWVPILMVLGLSDNTARELPSDYPNFDNVNYLPWQHNRVIYNPTLTIAIYPSYAKKGSTITIFDIINKKVLAEFPAILHQTRQPEWSPDGLYLAFAETIANRGQDSSGDWHYDQELFLLNERGNLSRLTRFSDKYNDTQLGNVSWSPNGRYIAFWFNIDDGLQEQLAVFDFVTNLVTNYCVTGFNEFMGTSPKPVWSPDSRLVVVNSKESDEKSEKVIWVDIAYGQGAIMDTGISVEGWLTIP